MNPDNNNERNEESKEELPCFFANLALEDNDRTGPSSMVRYSCCFPILIDINLEVED